MCGGYCANGNTYSGIKGTAVIVGDASAEGIKQIQLELMKHGMLDSRCLLAVARSLLKHIWSFFKHIRSLLKCIRSLLKRVRSLLKYIGEMY